MRFAAEKSLAGDRRSLSGYVIATEVFGRPESFDPQSDPIVRVEATRLRKKLLAYYADEGHHDPLRLAMPKGGYGVQFEPVMGAGVADKKGRPWLVALSLVTGSVATAGIAAYLLWPKPDLEPGAGPPQQVPAEASNDILAIPRGPSIAVLPPRTAGERGKELASAIREQIIVDLTRFHNLRTMAPAVGPNLAKAPEGESTAAFALGIDYLLDLYFATGADDIRSTAHLVQTRDNRTIWSKNVDKPLNTDELGLLISETAAAIVAAIASNDGIIDLSERLALGSRAQPRTLDGYSCFLLTNEYYAQVSQEFHARVRDCLETSLEIDPGYASNWAALAFIILDEVRAGFNPQEDTLKRAREAAARAVEIEPFNGLSYRALAAVAFVEHRLEEFRANAEKALELNPNDAEALADLGSKIAYSGDWDRGLAMQRKSIALNPNYPIWQNWLFVYDGYRQRNYAKALEILGLFEMPGYFLHPMLKAATLAQLDRLDEAGAEIDKLEELMPDAANHAVEHFRSLNFSDELTARFLEGLAKAGLGVGKG